MWSGKSFHYAYGTHSQSIFLRQPFQIMFEITLQPTTYLRKHLSQLIYEEAV